MKNKSQEIRIEDIDIAVGMIKKYIVNDEINLLITALESLKVEPANMVIREQVVEEFNKLGILQGAVLTYAPYLNVFVSDDPFGE